MRLATICTVIAALCLAGCGMAPDTARAAVKAESTRKSAPDFTLKDADGKVVKLSDYKGKVVLLNFWATWCGPCKIEIPWFVEFEQNYRDKGFAVLGVSMDEDGWESVKPYLAANKVNYRVVIGDDMTAQKYGGVESLPTSFIVDQEGRTAVVHIGLVSKKDYKNDIEHLLGISSGKNAAVVPVAPGARGAE
ncbi:MAG TPA: redoxin domain-containing protein [Bryobacteraceae bacterium]|nr:redoxin domain-containing protein [Bryobacteraceae bacterium]